MLDGVEVRRLWGANLADLTPANTSLGMDMGELFKFVFDGGSD